MAAVYQTHVSPYELKSAEKLIFLWKPYYLLIKQAILGQKDSEIGRVERWIHTVYLQRSGNN